MVFRPGQHPTGLLSQRSGTFTKTRCSGFGFRGAWRNLAVQITTDLLYVFLMDMSECFPWKAKLHFPEISEGVSAVFVLWTGTSGPQNELWRKKRPISFVNNKGQIIKTKARCLPWICEVNSLLYPFIWTYHPISSTSQRRISALPDGKNPSHLWFRSWLIQDTLQKQFSSDL